EQERHRFVVPRRGIADGGDRHDGQVHARRRQQREVSAGRVTDENEPLSEIMCMCDRAQDVLERAGPAATRIADATVLDVPRRNAFVAERVAEVSYVDEVVCRLPRASVEDDRERARLAAGGHAQVTEVE